MIYENDREKSNVMAICQEFWSTTAPDRSAVYMHGLKTSHSAEIIIWRFSREKLERAQEEPCHVTRIPDNPKGLG